MKYVHMVLVMVKLNVFMVKGLVPDIDLVAKILTENSITVYQFVCSTNIAVWQCTVEFLIDEKTHDDFRYVTKTCYHKNGICSPKICACSEGCESFTWNLTVTQIIVNHSYSCVSKMETGGITYLANITIKPDNNNGFKLLKKLIVPVSVVTPSQKSTTVKPEIITDSITSVQIIIISVVSSTCLLTIIVLSVVCWKICCSEKNKPDDTVNQNTRISSSANDFGFGRNMTDDQQQTKLRFQSDPPHGGMLKRTSSAPTNSDYRHRTSAGKQESGIRLIENDDRFNREIKGSTTAPNHTGPLPYHYKMSEYPEQSRPRPRAHTTERERVFKSTTSASTYKDLTFSYHNVSGQTNSTGTQSTESLSLEQIEYAPANKSSA
ncbi:uncharacterized protein [Mytilus edulis]